MGWQAAFVASLVLVQPLVGVKGLVFDGIQGKISQSGNASAGISLVAVSGRLSVVKRQWSSVPSTPIKGDTILAGLATLLFHHMCSFRAPGLHMCPGIMSASATNPETNPRCPNIIQVLWTWSTEGARNAPPYSRLLHLALLKVCNI